MASMFAFGIKYLNGFVAATKSDDLGRTEWPPHPGRVFMALVAAHFETGGDPVERAALQWLEELEDEDGRPLAPSLVAPEIQERVVVKQYVPVNDSAAGSERKGKEVKVFQEIGCSGLRRNRQDRQFTRAWLERDTVYLIWSDIEPTRSVQSALATLVAKVSRIGHSTSMVQMWLAEADEFGELDWIPDEGRAETYLRLAPRGTLADLERRFNAEACDEFADLTVRASDRTNSAARRAARRKCTDQYPNGAPTRLRPSLSYYQGYARPERPREVVVLGSEFDPHMVTMRIEREQGPYRHLDLTSTLKVVQRWREALLSECNDLPETVRCLLSGHGVSGAPLDRPHIAFAPLAFVGHEHADGRLLGLAVVLPRSLTASDRRDVFRVLRRVRQIKLGPLGLWSLTTATNHRMWNMRAVSWTAHPTGATEWSTVTPIAFDRHPKSRNSSAYRRDIAEMLRRACGRSGLPSPLEIIVTEISVHSGVLPAHQFPKLRRKDGSSRRHTHAILVFNEPVRGPIIIGAGRYRGYGFLRPLGPVASGRSIS